MPPVQPPVPAVRTARRLVVALTSVAMLLAACGGGATTAIDTDSNIVDAGSFKVELPDEIVVVDEEDTPDADTAEPATDTGQAASDGAASDGAASEPEPEPTADPDAIPLAEESNPVTAMFDSFQEFQDCLERLGSEFIGVPDPEIPETVDPAYIADLQTCAAESGILEAQQNLNAASAERTLEETEVWNEGILLFAECLRGKGWSVPEPVPDANGSLQIGTNDSVADGFEPPPGEDLIENPTLQECATEAQREAEAAAAENG